VLVFSLTPSLVDVGTDGFSAEEYIVGHNYIKHVKNVSEGTRYGGICSHIGRYIKFDENCEETISYEEVRCYETDHVWGTYTIVLMFLPGLPELLGSGTVWAGLEEISKLKYWFLRLFSFLCFPLLLVCVKFYGLLNPGIHWKKLTKRITSNEGTFESTLQFILQLVIIFTRGDRHPSHIQLISMVVSSIMLMNSGMDRYIVNETPMKLMEEIRRKGRLLFLFTPAIIFKVGSFAALAALLKYWCFVAIIAEYFLILLIALGIQWKMGISHLTTGLHLHFITLTKHFRSTDYKKRFKQLIHSCSPFKCRECSCCKWELVKARDMTPKESVENLIFGNTIWSFFTWVILTGFTIKASVDANMEIPGMDGFRWHDGYNLSNIEIVRKIELLWYIYGAITASGFFSSVAIYFEYKKIKENSRSQEESAKDL